MNPATVAVDTEIALQMVQIATRLVATLDEAITASNDNETLAAWNDAKKAFRKALADTAPGEA